MMLPRPRAKLPRQESPERPEQDHAMRRAWSTLPEFEQLTLANGALSHAFDVFVANAEQLATEFDQGSLTDRGGAESLRLLICIIRTANRAGLSPVGHA